MYHSVADLAYLAGLIDGEGHLTIESSVKAKNRTSKHPEGYRTHVVLVNVTNTDVPMIEWLYYTFGGRLYLQLPNDKYRRMKTIYRWTMYGPLIDSLLPQVIPYLKTKKQQAEVIMQFRTTVSRDYRSGGLPPGTLEFREELRKEIRRLNNLPPVPPLSLPLVALAPKKAVRGFQDIQSGFILDQTEG